MGKLLRIAVLFSAIAGLMSAVDSAAAPAQVKDKEKDKKDTKAVTEESGYTEIYMAKDGWRFRIKNSEGKSIAIGTISFEKKEDCLKTVEAVKTALLKGKVNEIKEEKKQ